MDYNLMAKRSEMGTCLLPVLGSLPMPTRQVRERERNLPKLSFWVACDVMVSLLISCSHHHTPCRWCYCLLRIFERTEAGSRGEGEGNTLPKLPHYRSAGFVTKAHILSKFMSPPTESPTSMEMLPHHTLWSSTMICLPMSSWLYRRIIKPMGSLDRVVIPVPAAPLGYSVGLAYPFEQVHHPAVSGRK